MSRNWPRPRRPNLSPPQARWAGGIWRADRSRSRPRRARYLRGNGTIAELFGERRRAVMLFGAGHVGRALDAGAGAACPLRSRWVDPRPQAFPGPCRRQCDARSARRSAAGRWPRRRMAAFVVIVTHSHALDLAVLDAALAEPRASPMSGSSAAPPSGRAFEAASGRPGMAPRPVSSFHCPIGIARHPLPASRGDCGGGGGGIAAM